MKYVLSTIGGIHTQIAKPTEIEGYTEGVMEVFLPETEGWSESKINKWVAENNNRMEAICKFLNENEL